MLVAAVDYQHVPTNVKRNRPAALEKEQIKSEIPDNFMVLITIYICLRTRILILAENHINSLPIFRKLVHCSDPNH